MVKEDLMQRKLNTDLQRYVFKAIPQGFSSTNDITNAGLRERRNIWNLYIHLCWLTISNNLVPHLSYRRPLAHILKKNP